MNTVEAVTNAFAEARERGALVYPAYEKAVAVYLERYPGTEVNQALQQVVRMIDEAVAASAGIATPLPIAVRLASIARPRRNGARSAA
jgi:primosomal protein N'